MPRVLHVHENALGKFADKLSTSGWLGGVQLGERCGAPCGRHAASHGSVSLGVKATCGFRT